MKRKLYRAFVKSGHDFALTDLKRNHENREFHKLSYHDVLYLNIIDCHPNKYTTSQIADLLKITRPAVTQRINDLVKKGYIVRTQSETDKRIFYLSVNEDSDYYDDLTEEDIFQIEEAFIEKYGEANLDFFCEMMDFVTDHFEVCFEKGDSNEKNRKS